MNRIKQECVYLAAIQTSTHQVSQGPKEGHVTFTFLYRLALSAAQLTVSKQQSETMSNRDIKTTFYTSIIQ